MAEIPATDYIQFFYDVDNIMKDIDNKFSPVASALKAVGSEWIGLKYMRRWNPFRWAIQNPDTNTAESLGLPLELDDNFIILSQVATKSVQIFEEGEKEPTTISGLGQNTYIGFRQEFYDNNIKKFIEKVSRYYYLYFESPNGCRCFYGRLKPEKVEDDILNSGTGVDCDEPKNKDLNDPKSKFFPLYRFNELITCNDSRLYKCSVNSTGGWTFAGNDEYSNYVFIRLDESDQGPFCDRQNIANNAAIKVSESTLTIAQKYSTNMSIGPLGPISYSLYRNENDTNAVNEIRVVDDNIDENKNICFKEGDLYCCSNSTPKLDETLTYVGYVLKPRSGMQTLMTIAPESQDSFFMDLIAKFFASSVYNTGDSAYSNNIKIYIPGSGFAYVSYTAEVFMSFSRNLFEFSNVFCRGTTSGYTKLWCHQTGETPPPIEPICGIEYCNTLPCYDTMPEGKATVIRFTTDLDKTTSLVTGVYNNYECQTLTGGTCRQSCGNCMKKSETGDDGGITVDPSGTLINLGDPCGCEEPKFECSYEHGNVSSHTEIIIFPIHISLAVSSITLDIKSSLFPVYIESLKNALTLLNNSLTQIEAKLSVPPVSVQPLNDLTDYFIYQNSVLFGTSMPYTHLPTLGYFVKSLVDIMEATKKITGSNTVNVAYELGCGNDANNYEELFFKEQIDNCDFITLYANRNLKYHATTLSDFVPTFDTGGYSMLCKVTTDRYNLGDIDLLDYVKISDFGNCNEPKDGSGCEMCTFASGGESFTPPGHDDSGGEESTEEGGGGENTNKPSPGYRPNNPEKVPDVCKDAYYLARTEAELNAEMWYDGRYISVTKTTLETVKETNKTRCTGYCYICDKDGKATRVSCTYGDGSLQDGLCCTDGYTITSTYKQSCTVTVGFQANKYQIKPAGVEGDLGYILIPAHEVYVSYTKGPEYLDGPNKYTYFTNVACECSGGGEGGGSGSGGEGEEGGGGGGGSSGGGHNPSKPDEVCEPAYELAKAEAKVNAENWIDGRYISVTKTKTYYDTKYTYRCAGRCYDCTTSPISNPPCEYDQDGSLKYPGLCDQLVTIINYYSQSCTVTVGWQADKYQIKPAGADGKLAYVLVPAHEVYVSYTKGPSVHDGSDTLYSTQSPCA